MPEPTIAQSDNTPHQAGNLSSLRVIFAGTPEFSVPALEALVEAGANVVAVLTQPDRPSGRGKKLTPGAVKQCATALSIDVLQPLSLKDDATFSTLQALRPDLVVVVAYGLLLPQRVLDLPRHGCLNIHGSLLPRWRGAAPIHRAVLAGDSQTGVTIMQMEAGLDTGPMIASESLAITSESTTASLHDQLAVMGARTLVSVLADWCDGRITAVAQDDSLATYADKLDKREATVNWQHSARQIDLQVRGLNPWPVAESWCNETRVRFYEGIVQPAVPGGTPGEVLSCSRAGIAVQTGDGVYCITRLQWPGKRVMTAAESVNSRDITGLYFSTTAPGA